MPPPHGHHHGHHAGHIPRSAFNNWNWPQPSVQYVVLQDEDQVPDWLWIAGGAMAGIVLALLTRGR